MPSGLTAGVQKGTITTLQDFAMLCATQFLPEMRDASGPIAPVVEPATYHKEALEAANSELLQLLSMSPEDAEQKALKRYAEEMRDFETTTQKKNAQRLRYQSMLQQVIAWQVSEDVRPLKDFMLQQLQDSIRYDCDPSYPTEPQPQSGAEWHSSQIMLAQKNIVYHTEHYAREVERTAQRNKWVKELTQSLETK